MITDISHRYVPVLFLFTNAFITPLISVQSRCFGERMDLFKILSKAKFDPTFTCNAPSSIASDLQSWW